MSACTASQALRGGSSDLPLRPSSNSNTEKVFKPSTASQHIPIAHQNNQRGKDRDRIL